MLIANKTILVPSSRCRVSNLQEAQRHTQCIGIHGLGLVVLIAVHFPETIFENLKDGLILGGRDTERVEGVVEIHRDLNDESTG